MNAKISTFHAISTCLFLAITSLGAGPRITLDPRLDDPQPSREMIEAGLKKHRAFVLKLEDSLQLERDKVKLELTDAVPGQRALIVKADKDLEKAKVARKRLANPGLDHLPGNFDVAGRSRHREKSRPRAPVSQEVKPGQPD